MYYFLTSVNNAYLPKAITLAQSIRRVYGDQAHVTCMLSDDKAADIDYSAFDEVLTIADLNLPVESLEGWIFKHAVVELCTAVKPWAFKHIIAKHQPETVVYLDPDTVLYSPMEELYEILKTQPVVVTPHVTVPATDTDDLLDGEMLGSLRHGVFNLGFLGIATYGQGLEFIDWWGARCLDWCYDDGPKGLFTDQRWVDLAPCFFTDMHVLRHPGYNMATWNLYYRQISRDAQQNYWVNGDQPLRFFHFSGFDIGTHELMLQKHAPNDPVLRDMSNWYVAEQARNGQERLGKRPSPYDFFADGSRIERPWRHQYREEADLPKRFPKPYSETGFQEWLGKRAQTAPSPHEPEAQVSARHAQVASILRKYPRLNAWAQRTLSPELKAKIRRFLR